MLIVLRFFSRVAPIPNLDKSQVIFVGNFESRNFGEMFSLTIDLSLSSQFLSVTLESQVEFLIGFLNLWVCSESCGINLLRYTTIQFLEKLVFDFLSFCGSAQIRFPDILCCKNISSIVPNPHLYLFSFKPFQDLLSKNA